MSKLALSRNRAPMGGRFGLDAVPSPAVAGQMYEVSVVCAWTRMAWVMTPACTSS
jgi:hypothetical protein